MTQLYKSFLLVVIFTFNCFYAITYAQDYNNVDEATVKLVNEKLSLYDFSWIHKGGWNELYDIPVHPAFDSLRNDDITEHILSLINQRKSSVGDTLSTPSFFYCWKPYFDWLRGIDPHYTVIPSLHFDVNYYDASYGKKLTKKTKEFYKKAKIVPVNVLNVNDTLFVSTSLDKELKYGDIIKSVNGVSSQKFLKYSYSIRHAPLYVLMYLYSAGTIEDKYEIELMRNGKSVTVVIDGINIKEALFRLDKIEQLEDNIKQFDNIGYLKISQFFAKNSRLTRLIRKNILDFKKSGCKDVILDLRGNPGGNGNNFDELLSIFIDKPSISYCSSNKVKVSKVNIDEYKSINGAEIGKLIDRPDSEANYTFPLHQKLYIEGVSYYILMDEGTGSMAASFCNILQFNGAATLVGEPLLRNAMKYGDTLDFTRFFYSTPNSQSSLPFFASLAETGVSTTETIENTKAVDGILYPDIAISYNTKQLAMGNDNVLKDLIKIINGQ